MVVIVVLKFPTNVGDFIAYCKGILLQMTGNVHIPVPYPSNVPSLDTVNETIEALVEAQSIAQTKLVGSAAARDVQKRLVMKDMRALRNMVEAIAQNNLLNAETIVESTDMKIKRTGGRTPLVFAAKNVGLRGTPLLTGPAIKGHRGAHLWEHTTDLKNFSGRIAAQPTTDASTYIPGLIPGVEYAFFHKTVTKDGDSNWDGPIFLLVI